MAAQLGRNGQDDPIAVALARLQREVQLLKTYATGLTAVLALAFVCGAYPVAQKPKFEEIDVERLNVVEADGKLRMVLANQARFPEVLLDGQTIPGRQGTKSAGMLFYNDKGECGGLSFGSAERAGGYTASAGLMFDQYRQDQTIGLQYSESNGQRSAGLRIWDRPDVPLTELLERREAIRIMPDGPEKREAARKLEEAMAQSRTRVVVGKGGKKEAVVMLADAQGRPRIHLVVDAAGDPRLEFLDESGKVVHRLPPVPDGHAPNAGRDR